MKITNEIIRTRKKLKIIEVEGFNWLIDDLFTRISLRLLIKGENGLSMLDIKNEMNNDLNKLRHHYIKYLQENENNPKQVKLDL